VEDSKVEEVEDKTVPLSNDEIGLKMGLEAKVNPKVNPLGPTVNPLEPEVNPLEPKVNPNPDPNTNPHPNLGLEVVKGEGQKADGASVPTQLWDQAFLVLTWIWTGGESTPSATSTSVGDILGHAGGLLGRADAT
jgi:hypothetical protein